jgi:hypothetical protein
MKDFALKIYALAQELILNPKEFWKSHHNLKGNHRELSESLLYPLIATAAATVFLGEFFRSDYFRIWIGLLWVVRKILLFGAIYYMGVYGTNKILKYLNAEQNEAQLQILVIYSMIPFLLVSIVTGLLPFLRFLDIFGVYGFYIFWLGSKRLLHFQEDKLDNMVLRVTLANWIVFVLLSFISSYLLKLLD